MKKIILTTILLFSITIVSAQMVAKAEMKEKVEGICDNENVYALFSGFEGQVQPKCSLSKVEMQKLLNEVQFLKENPKFSGKGMVGLYINCKGEVLGWEIDIKSKKELDQQLLVVFKTFNNWTVGTFYGENVDCSELISYKIKKGVLTIN